MILPLSSSSSFSLPYPHLPPPRVLPPPRSTCATRAGGSGAKRMQSGAAWPIQPGGCDGVGLPGRRGTGGTPRRGQTRAG